MGSQYCGYLELALEAIFLGVFENDSYSAVRNRIIESWAVLSRGRRVRNRKKSYNRELGCFIPGTAWLIVCLHLEAVPRNV
ncbi:hypothetical protein Lal_00041446 [Lupinus albus]|nr:hypothetical protein Lal_00041446 [Lupinus albus]